MLQLLVTSLRRQTSVWVETGFQARTGDERTCAVQVSGGVECALSAASFGKLAHSRPALNPQHLLGCAFFLHFPPYVVAIFLFLAGFNVFACHLQFVKEVHKT